MPWNLLRDVPRRVPLLGAAMTLQDLALENGGALEGDFGIVVAGPVTPQAPQPSTTIPAVGSGVPRAAPLPEAPPSAKRRRVSRGRGPPPADAAPRGRGGRQPSGSPLPGGAPAVAAESAATTAATPSVASRSSGAVGADTTPTAPPPPAVTPALERRAGDLLVAPVVRFHGGHMGEPVGERSAGFQQFVDGVEAYTHRNLVARLFVNKPDIGGRLIKIGSLYSSDLRGGLTPGGTAANVPPQPGDTRTAPQRERDSAAYVHMVALANYARGLGLSLINTQAVVVQALHLAEQGNHALVGAVTSVVKNHWMQHTVSATNKGTKTTINNYSGAVASFCRWAAEKYGDDVSVMPISRTMVVTFLEAEKVRRVVTRKRARRTTDGDEAGGSSDDEPAADTCPPTAVRGGGGAAEPAAAPPRAADNEEGLCEPAARAAHAATNVRRGAVAPQEPEAAPGAEPATGDTPPNSRTPGALSQEDTAAPGELPRQVGPQVLLNDVNALSKIANTLSLLFRDATCECCSRWRLEEYASAGSYGPAVSVVKQRKREKVLEDQAAGASKALGRRDPSMSDEQREAAVRRLLLLPTSATQYRLKSLLAALFVLSFALEARGATSRGIVWSDLVVRHFPAMFSAAGKALAVLCTYILATKTTEGITHCIGSLPHVNPWLCPVGAMADALIATYHRPGSDTSRPPVSFAPIHNPSEEQMLLCRVDPAAFQAANHRFGLRPWYRMLMFQSALGGIYKEMPYQYHAEHLKATLVASGVPAWAASTHVCRRAAAQKGKEAGASESDNKQQGIWSTSMAKGAYDAPIPNAVMTLGLSGRPLSCTAPVTPRLEVQVPTELQRTICPWLEAEEAAYAERVARNVWDTDEALVNHFRIIRWVRSAYFQTWAARLATGGVPSNAFILRHPLLTHPLFAPFAATMEATLSNLAQAAADAVQQMIPQLAPCVEAAVMASTAAATAELQRHEEYLTGRLDDGFSAVSAHAKEHADAILAAGASAQKANSEELTGLRSEIAQLRAVLSRLVPLNLAAATLPSTTTLPQRGACAGLDAGLPALLPAPNAPRAGAASALPQLSASLQPGVQQPPSLPTVPTMWLKDKQKVNELTVLKKLEGVPIADDGKRCVPLVGMEPNLSWEMALDEYAFGTRTRLSLREAEQHFGSLWRLMEPDAKKKKRLTGLYSSRLPLYRAFEREYAQRGRVVGVAGVVSILKQKYPDKRRSKEIIKAMAVDYPSSARV